MNNRILFLASCIALVTTAMSFAIRGDIMTDFERDFVKPYVAAGSTGADQNHDQLVKTNLGIIAGVAFFSFGLAIYFGGPLVDLLGMGALLRLAALCHIGGALLTIFAPSFWVVVLATLIVGAGNGIVEAVCNPLIATIYPDDKTHKLTLFHAWFPGGIVIGGLLSYGFSQIGLGWQMKMGMLLVPAAIYTAMIFGQKFPPTERVAAGVPFRGMFAEAVRRPLFWIVFVMMWLTAATELGPGAWISNVYNDVMGQKEGILALVWGSILMYVLRQFFSRKAHSVSPVALIAITAPFATVGLFLFRFATTPVTFFAAATLLYVGVCFWWPTMLGMTSERCPKTGSLGLAIIGGTGSFSTFFAGPIMGRVNDAYGPAKCLQLWAILPAIITVVFLLLYLSDRAKGGYKVEKL
jgi:MFS family permease